jgi:hypothetical protein
MMLRATERAEWPRVQTTTFPLDPLLVPRPILIDRFRAQTSTTEPPDSWRNIPITLNDGRSKRVNAWFQQLRISANAPTDSDQFFEHR